MPAAPAAALKVAPARTALTMRSWISGGSLERRPPVRRRVGVVSIVGSTVTGGWCLCRVVAYRDAPVPVPVPGGGGVGGCARASGGGGVGPLRSAAACRAGRGGVLVHPGRRGAGRGRLRWLRGSRCR